MKLMHSHESGRSMVEMLGVLAIVGVLSVGGIAGYSQAMSKFKITKAMDQVQTIITNMRTLYASSRTYSALTANAAYDVGLLTDETFNEGETAGLNPFGGEIIFGVGNNNRSFTVEYTGLTPEACVKIATADWGADESSGLISLTLNDTQHIWRSQGGTNSILPIDVATAISECGSDTGETSIIWEYR